MSRKRKSTKKRGTSVRGKKGAGIGGSKLIIAAIVMIVVIGGAFAAFYLMPGRDAVTFDSATDIIRDRGTGTSDVPPATEPTSTGDINETPVDEYILTNPIQMNLFGIDVEGNRIPVPQPSVAAQSAYLGEIEIFDIEFDVSWNFISDLTANPDRYMSDVDVMVMLSLVDRSVSDIHGNVYTDSYVSGVGYPESFTYNHTILAADLLSEGVATITLSLVDDLYGLFEYTDINDIDGAVLTAARDAGLMNQILEDDNVTITELTGMLTYDYGILGYYTVNELGSEANMVLKRLTVTTDPVVPEEVGGMSAYDIGGATIDDSALLVVGLGVFSAIVVYYYMSRRR